MLERGTSGSAFESRATLRSPLREARDLLDGAADDDRVLVAASRSSAVLAPVRVIDGAATATVSEDVGLSEQVLEGRVEPARGLGDGGQDALLEVRRGRGDLARTIPLSESITTQSLNVPPLSTATM